LRLIGTSTLKLPWMLWLPPDCGLILYSLSNNFSMKTKLIAALSALALITPAGATPVAVDNGLMVNVPNIGYSRLESVNYCLDRGGVDKYQDLITDSDFVNFERCLIDLT